MKKLFLVILLLMASLIYAEDTTKVLVAKKDLTPEQIQKIETNKTVQTVSQWVGLGKEVGVAMNEGLVALTQNAVNFSETGLGKYTMILIGWKVLGKEVTDILLRVFVAIPMWIILVVITIWSYVRTTMPRRVLVSKTYDNTAKKWNRQWKLINDNIDNDEKAGYAIVHAIIFLIISAVAAIVIL